MGRPHFSRTAQSTALLAALAIGLAACGSTNPGVTAREANAATSVEPQTSASTPAETSETVETSVPATDPVPTEPATTEPATTPPTQAPTTTTAPGVPSGWIHVDTFPEQVFPPFEESNWIGVPSPALAEPLADGLYAAGIGNRWNPQYPDELYVIVWPLAPCAELPAGTCVDTGVPYTPDEMGYTRNDNYTTMILTLDDTIRVALIGYDCDAFSATASGPDLVALYNDFHNAYGATIEPALADEAGIAAQLNASPDNGFSGVGGACGPDGYSVVFHDGGAPPLLLQTLTAEDIDSNGNGVGRRPLAPNDLVQLKSVQVVAGVMTLYFYAGFYS